MRYLPLALVLTVLLSGSDKPFHATPDRDYDVHHTRISLSVDVWGKKVEGNVSHTLSPLMEGMDRLAFDSEKQEIYSVFHEGTGPLSFEQTDKKLWINLGGKYGWDDTLTISIAYGATPRRGLYFVLPDSAYPEKHVQAWTQGEDMDNHYWVPIYDYPNDRATFECILTVDTPFVAVSNGELVSIKNNGESQTFHWRENYPMVSYLISFAVGEYVKVEDSYGEIPVNYWVYPEHSREDALRSFGRTPDMMAYFSNITGVKYPYEKYDQVIIEDFMYGGMENVTLTHQTDRTIHTERARPHHTSDGLVAHELAHQWYGDLLTTRNWANAWLNEGFATYFAMLWREHDKGYDDAEYSRYYQVKSVIWADNTDSRPVVQYHYDDSMELFDANIYAKGSVILNMLRRHLGDDRFWRAIRAYTVEYAFKNVETADLKEVIGQITGQNLYWFFDQWLYKGGLPEIEVDWKYSRANDLVTLTIKQVQALETTSLFKLPVTVLIDDGKIQRHRLFVEDRETTLTFPSEHVPNMVIFDEGFQIPKRLTHDKKEKELIYQLKHAPHVVDRIWAAEQLRKRKPRRSTPVALMEAMRSDPFWGVRAAAANAYGNLKQKTVDQALIDLIANEQDVRVRRAFIPLLGDLESENARDFLLNTIRESPKDYIISTAIRTLAQMDSSLGDTSRVEEIIDRGLKTDSHGETIRRAATYLLGTSKSEDHFQRLVELAEYGGSPQEVRESALGQLLKYRDSHPEVIDLMAGYLNDPSRMVRRRCIDLLARHGTEEHYDALDDLVQRDPLDARRVRNAKERIASRLESEEESSRSLEEEVRRLKRILEKIQSVLKDYE